MKIEHGSVMDRGLGMGVRDGILGLGIWDIVVGFFFCWVRLCMYVGIFFWFSIYMNVVFDICFHMFSYVYLRCV